jgi:lipopolysaccharide assembly outer membrane protein LptD (OstA)
LPLWKGRISRKTASGTDSLLDGRFVEGSVGFGYRPEAHDRLNLLGKYKYLHDLSGFSQEGGTGVDQKSQVLSLEGLYDLSKNWSVGGKLALVHGELREGRGSGDWYESTTSFIAVRALYHLPKRWDALVEYRWLSMDETDTDRRGALIGIHRQVGRNLKLGVGYNFTDFSDDLTHLDYDARGWFLNLSGQY